MMHVITRSHCCNFFLHLFHVSLSNRLYNGGDGNKLTRARNNIFQSYWHSHDFIDNLYFRDDEVLYITKPDTKTGKHFFSINIGIIDINLDTIALAHLSLASDSRK